MENHRNENDKFVLSTGYSIKIVALRDELAELFNMLYGGSRQHRKPYIYRWLYTGVI